MPEESGVGTARAQRNYPAWKADTVRKAEDVEGVVTEIEEERYGHSYHATQEADGVVWMATIRTDSGEKTDRDEVKRDVTFRRCEPESEHHVLYEWSTVAVKRLRGPSDLDSWRAIFRVFEAADELLRTHDRAVPQEGESR